MGYEWLAVAMFIGFFLILMSGYPVAFSFAGTGLVFGLIGLMVGAFNINLVKLLPERWMGSMSTSRCWRFPISSSWALCWRSPAWPRICLKPSAS